MAASITQARLKEVLSYDPSTGLFTWACARGNGIKKGQVAGTVTTDGYIHISIDYKKYLAHRLAWLFTHGMMPEYMDHINHTRDDNRLVNLREATSSENNRNRSLSSKNTSGYMGVYWDKRDKKWQAKIRVGDKLIHLGNYTDIASAVSAREAANLKYNFHKNHGAKL